MVSFFLQIGGWGEEESVVSGKEKTPEPKFGSLVDGIGLEPMTPCTSSRCSSQLS